MLKSLLFANSKVALAELFVKEKQIDHTLILVEGNNYYRFDSGISVVGTLGLDGADSNMIDYAQYIYQNNGGQDFEYIKWLNGIPSGPTDFPTKAGDYAITREEIFRIENEKYIS